jgi:hypothetical protein
MASSVDSRVKTPEFLAEGLFFVHWDEFLGRDLANGALGRGLFTLVHIPTDDASPFHR